MQAIFGVYENSVVERVDGINKNGKPFSFLVQNVYLFKTDAPFPEEINIMIPDDRPTGYGEGFYEMDSKSITVGSFKRPSLNVFYLTQIPQPNHLKNISASLASSVLEKS